MRRNIKTLWQFFFGDSARAFGSLSVILLICLAIAPAEDRFREWTRYQQKYLYLIRGRGEAATLQRRYQGGLQQIWMPELGVTDRCGTCHLGMKEASLWDVSTQPFRPHPPIPHSLTEFGCVMCHRGQGAATGVEEAHRSTLAWEEPILPARYLESSCGQCHANTLTRTPQLNQGRKLLARYGCVSCHVLKTPEGRRMASTAQAPSLRHVAEKTSREWTFAWIKNPQAYAVTATMPNFQLTDPDARDISAFLMTQSTPYLPAGAPSQLPTAAADAQAGASVYGESFCASCHATVNAAGMLVGGDVGPELTRIGSKVKPAWLAEWLRNPKTYDPETAMPHYRFDLKQLGPLRGFLEAKTDSDLLANVHLEPATPAQIAHGRVLVTERGCASCHEINGIKKSDNFAPELTVVGSESLMKIVFAPGVAHTLPGYLQAKIRQPHTFPGSKMPQYTFTQPQVDGLVTALLAQTERARTLPAALRVPGKPGIQLPACRQSGSTDGRHELLQLPRHQRAGWRYGPGFDVGRQFRPAPLAGELHEESQHAASRADPPHAALQRDRYGGGNHRRLPFDGVSNASVRSRCIGCGEVQRERRRIGQAVVLFEVCMPVVPYHRPAE